MVERLRTFLRELGGRSLALLDEVGPERALAATIVILIILLLTLPLAAVYVGVLSLRQEAAEQQDARREEAPPAVQPEDFPINLGSGVNFGADGRPREIPGLSSMEVIGELRYVPGTAFRCPGGGPVGDGRLSKRTCRSSRAGDPAVYEVTVVEDDPKTVVSVTATARDAPDEEAARVLGRVASLAVGGLGPSDPEAWVDRTILSGGQYLAEGAEARIYGVQGDRTLEIVGAGLPTDTEPRPAGDSRPKTDQRKLDDALDEALKEAFGKTDSKADPPRKTTAEPK